MHYRFLQRQVADAMNAQPVTVTPDTSLHGVEQLFEATHHNSLPVVDGERRLVGVVTQFDVLKAFQLDDHHLLPPYDDLMAQPCAAVMTGSPHSVSPELPLSRVLAQFIETRDKSFPVVVDGRLVGVIGREDVLRALRETLVDPSPVGDAVVVEGPLP